MKKWISALLTLAMIGIIFWSCSDDDNLTGPGSNAPTYTDEGLIGELGGTVFIDDSLNSLNGAYVKIPKGALTSEIYVKISNATGEVEFPGDSTALILKLEPEGTEFLIPVEIGIPFEQERELTQLKMWNIDDLNDKMVQLPSEIDTNSGYIKATSSHFSYYTISNNGAHAELLMNYDSNKLILNMRVDGWAWGNNYGFEGIPTKIWSWPFGIYNAKQAVDQGDPLASNTILSYFKVKLKKKNNFWFDPTIAEKKVLVKRIGTYSEGFGGAVYETDLTANNLEYSAEKLNSSMREAYFSGSAIVITFNEILEVDETYYIDADWGLVGDIYASIFGGRYTSLYSLNTIDYALLPSEMNDNGFSDLNNNLVDDLFEIANNPPAISNITANPTSVQQNQSTILTCSATDLDGDILNYVWENTEGSISGSGSSVTWTAPSATGTYIITCTVSDGTASDSMNKNIIVSETPDVISPTVSITYPANNAEFDEGAVVTISGNASDNDSVAKVEFYIDDIKIGEDISSPYEYAWDTTDKDGNRAIKLKAYDPSGNMGETAVNTVIINAGNQSPVISSITADPASVLQNGTSTLTCIATDSDGDAINYIWSSSDGELSTTNGQTTTWTAPSTIGDYTITCTVNDGTVSVSDNCTVIVTDGAMPASMLFVEGGTFQMGDHFSEGDSGELPVHSVTISDFNIGKYEVTQSEWVEYMPTDTYDNGVGDDYPAYYTSWYKILVYCNKRSIAEGLTPCYSINGTNPDDWGSIPISSNSTWDVAVCNWTADGYRLPTEAEWEYVARGGIHNLDNYHYSGSDIIDNVAWYDGNNDPYGSKPVGTKAPNQLDIYDMSGNLWEWCWDWYGSYTSDSVTDPYGATSGSYRVLRGGFWLTPATYCRVSYRNAAYPYNISPPSGYGNYGFRVARNGSTTSNTPPSINNLTPEPASVLQSETSTITCSATDSDGDALTYEWTYSGGSITGSGSVITWTAPSITGEFTITCTVNDGIASVSDNCIVTVTDTPDTELPVVSITSPANNAEFDDGTQVAITGNASDNESVSRVEFYIDSILTSTDTSSPYEYTWESTNKVGSHLIYLKAFDPSGNMGETAANTLIINAVNHAPIISGITADPTSVLQNGVSTITCSATDSDGDVLTYEWTYTGGTISGSGSIVSWTAPSTVGNYTITCVVSDGELSDTDSRSIIVSETPDTTPPTVSITAPANNAEYNDGDQVVITGNASDNESVSRVEFYIDSVLTSTDTSSPYEFSWDSTGKVGSHLIYLKAFDPSGNMGETAVNTVIVNAVNHAPVISGIAADPTSVLQDGISTITCSASDPDGDTLTYEWTYTGGSISGSGSVISWTAPSTVGNYTITCVVSDGEFSDTDGASVAVTEIPNIAPTCQITTPADSSIIIHGDTITINVDADDSDGSIAEVRFYFDGIGISADNSFPYSSTVNTSTYSAGNYLVKAIAEDNDGVETIDEITIILNIPPTCAITSPTTDSMFNIGEIVSIAVDATDADKYSKSITDVKFYIDDVLEFTDTDLAYSYDWNTTSYSSGSHVVKAIVTDNNGTEIIDEITINLNSVPTCTITSPVNNDVINIGETVTIVANASDSDKSVNDVKFYIDGTLLNTDTTSPYSYDWNTTSYASGSHTVKAIVTDNNDTEVFDEINVDLNTIPVINSLIAEPFAILPNETSTITCDATDADGDSLTYEWTYSEGTISGTTSSEVWTAPSVFGYYMVKCIVSDNSITISDSIYISVAPNNMIYVKGGNYLMGDFFDEGTGSELPVHSVIVSDFNIGVYEITQSEWETYMILKTAPDYGVGDNYPVYYVSWYEIMVYCNKRSLTEGITPCYTISSSTDPDNWGEIPTSTNSSWDSVICNWNANGYRLPTEAEWEYASRGGIYWSDNYRYSGSDIIDNIAWYSGTASEHTSYLVGTKSPNQLGIYDMSGNVEEWCWDWWDYNFYTTCDNLGTVTNPVGSDSMDGRIRRGGNWVDPAIRCRVASKNLSYPYDTDVSKGFRIVRRP